MVKKKNQKKVRASYKPKENPFNIKINRNKHNILGQKLKGAQGLPGVSHSIGNAKRKEIFFKKKLSQKANQFLDKRFINSSLTSEEKATAQFIQEKKRKIKKNIFNLNDEEAITHKGMVVDKSFKDNILDSDEDDAELDQTFRKQVHFGSSADSSNSTKSHKEIIDDLIIESKKRKYEQKLAKEQNSDLIEKLDKEWKAMHSSLPAKKPEIKEVSISEPNDPFDVMLKELKFEMRTAPITTSKTLEEIEKEEKEKMKNLEEERYKRMLNPMDIPVHGDNQLSADSIYDGIDIQFEPVSEHDSDKETQSENGDFENDDSSSGDSEDECNDIHKINEVDLSINTENTVDIPDTKEKLYNLLKKQDGNESVAIENVLKRSIKNKTKQNLDKLEKFFAAIVEYIIESNNCLKKSFELLDSLIHHLYTLAEISSVNTSQKLLEMLDKEQDIFQKSKGKKLKKNFPKHSCLIIFKICSTLYSASDFKHPVVTPAIIFMCDVLSSVYACSFINMYFRLIICHILYDCVSYSKRYIPEVFYFLNKTLLLIMDKNRKFNLYVDCPKSIKIAEEISEEIWFQCDDSNKLRIISDVLELLYKYANLYVQLPSFHEIFSESLNICLKLQTLDYPNFLKEKLSKFITTIHSVKPNYKHLTFPNQKPVPLKLFEPAFDSKFTTRKDDIQKKRKMVKKVEQKIRREEKGLLREIRRTNQVIASEKLKERLEADEERKRKVKHLYQELAMQEGEYKNYIKKK